MSGRASSLPRVRVDRYVTPLREGGSLPGLIEGDDLGSYVCKFYGAGQGPRVLVAEVIVGELARAIGLDTPQLVALELDPAIARYEADEEVQDLLNKSPGLNLGVDFLPGSFGYDGSAATGDAQTSAELAATIVWLDALCANVDRSWRNPNLLVWNGSLYVIDHGASLYFHHGWTRSIGSPERFAVQAYDVSDHVLLPQVTASALAEADARLRALVTRDLLDEVVSLVPDAWLTDVPEADPATLRAAYVDFLTARLASDAWLPELPGVAT